MRTITINNAKYNVDCNALTYLYYNKIFAKSIFEDIDIIKEFLFLQLEKTDEQELIKKLDSYIEALNKLIYIAIYTNDKDIEDYKNWIHNFNILENVDCIKIIIEVIIDCFIDEKVSIELEKINSSGDDTEVLFPEYFFISACLKTGLTMQDLEKITYIDVMKIFLACNKKKTDKPRKATQSDWDRLASLK